MRISKIKRFMATLLAMVMVMGITPMGALAADTSEPLDAVITLTPDTNQTDSVETTTPPNNEVSGNSNQETNTPQTDSSEEVNTPQTDDEQNQQVDVPTVLPVFPDEEEVPPVETTPPTTPDGDVPTVLPVFPDEEEVPPVDNQLPNTQTPENEIHDGKDKVHIYINNDNLCICGENDCNVTITVDGQEYYGIFDGEKITIHMETYENVFQIGTTVQYVTDCGTSGSITIEHKEGNDDSEHDNGANNYNGIVTLNTHKQEYDIPVKFYVLDPNRGRPSSGEDQGHENYFPSAESGSYNYADGMSGTMTQDAWNALKGDDSLTINDSYTNPSGTENGLNSSWFSVDSAAISAMYNHFGLNQSTHQIVWYVVKCQSSQEDNFGYDDNNQKADIHVDGYIKNADVTVTYHSNFDADETYDDNAQTGDYTTKTYAATELPVREGYTFLGWSENSDATEPTYDEAETFVLMCDLQLYAVWKQNVVSFDINKIDSETKAPLEGVEFTIYSDADCTQVVETVTTDANGNVTVTLPAGKTYYMKETKALAGYNGSNTVYTINTSTEQTEGNLWDKIVSFLFGQSEATNFEDGILTVENTKMNSYKVVANYYTVTDGETTTDATNVVLQDVTYTNDTTANYTLEADDYMYQGQEYQLSKDDSAEKSITPAKDTAVIAFNLYRTVNSKAYYTVTHKYYLVNSDSSEKLENTVTTDNIAGTHGQVIKAASVTADTQDGIYEVISRTGDITLDKNNVKNITITYKRYQYAVTTNADEGVDTVTGIKTYNKGDNATVTFTLKAGYRLDQVLDNVDDSIDITKDIKNNNGVYSYTIENIKSNHEIEIKTEKIPYKLTVKYVFTDESTHDGFKDYTEDKNYYVGDNYTVTAPTAPAGYNLVKNDSLKGTFNASDITVTIKYQPNGSATATVKYIANINGEDVQIKDSKTFTDLIGRPYDVSDAQNVNEITYNGKVYVFNNDGGNAAYKGTLTGDVTITRTYVEKAQYTVTVNYVSENAELATLTYDSHISTPIYVGGAYDVTANIPSSITDANGKTWYLSKDVTGATGTSNENVTLTAEYYLKPTYTITATYNTIANGVTTTETETVNLTTGEVDSVIPFDKAYYDTLNGFTSENFNNDLKVNDSAVNEMPTMDKFGNYNVTLSYTRYTATTYKVIHNYYANGSLEATDETTLGGNVGDKITANDITKQNTYKGITYSYTSASDDITLAPDANSNTVTLRYDRTYSTGGGGGSTTNPPTEPEEPEVDIEDPDVPLTGNPDVETDIEDPDVPLTRNPDVEIDIEDPDVPLIELPELPDETIIEEDNVPLAQTSDEVNIGDEEVPLANLPQTGMIAGEVNQSITIGMILLTMILLSTGFIYIMPRKSKED